MQRKWSIALVPSQSKKHIEADVYFAVIGVKHHPKECHKPGFYYPTAEGRDLYVTTCNCPMMTDGLHLSCPKCLSEGYIYTYNGPTHLSAAKPHQVFQYKGKPEALSVKERVSCLSCRTCFKIRGGVIEEEGKLIFPKLDDKDLTELLKQDEYEGFLNMETLFPAGEENVRIF